MRHLPARNERALSCPEYGPARAVSAVSPGPQVNPHGAAGIVALGVLLDGRMQQGWVLAALRQALAVQGVRLATVAVARCDSRPSFAALLQRARARFDRRLRCPTELLLERRDVAAALGAPLLEIEVVRRGDGWLPTEASAAALRRCEADVWLCFSAVPPCRPLPPVSRRGVWGIEIGDGVPAGRDWAGANEIGAGSPVTMVSVVDYARSGSGVLYRSFGATVRNSITRNRLACLRKATGFFRRLLEQLTRGADAGSVAPPAAPARYPALREPTLASCLSLCWSLGSGIAANRMRALRRPDQWQIAYCFADGRETGFRPESLRYLVPPRDRFWADPFAIEREGRYFIFFEEFSFRTRRGRIMAVEVSEHGAPGEPQVALERPYHLSYPFLLEWEGSLYMLPETAENGTVEIYRCEAFPLRWSLHRVLLDNVRAYDATLWRQDDRWWMFVNLAEPGADSSDELHLYWGPSPLGPWTAHRGNPVVSDARCARPAGPLFARDGKLYRPSQDCSLSYGYSVLINRVDALGEDEYRETAVRRILPGWRNDVLCVHTCGGSNRLRVVDCLVRRRRGPGKLPPERHRSPMS